MTNTAFYNSILLILMSTPSCNIGLQISHVIPPFLQELRTTTAYNFVAQMHITPSNNRLFFLAIHKLLTVTCNNCQAMLLIYHFYLVCSPLFRQSTLLSFFICYVVLISSYDKQLNMVHENASTQKIYFPLVLVSVSHSQTIRAYFSSHNYVGDYNAYFLQ